MARICSACRQPVGRNPQDHDCPALPDPDDDEPGEDSSDEDEEVA